MFICTCSFISLVTLLYCSNHYLALSGLELYGTLTDAVEPYVEERHVQKLHDPLTLQQNQDIGYKYPRDRSNSIGKRNHESQPGYLYIPHPCRSEAWTPVFTRITAQFYAFLNDYFQKNSWILPFPAKRKGISLNQYKLACTKN